MVMMMRRYQLLEAGQQREVIINQHDNNGCGGENNSCPRKSWALFALMVTLCIFLYLPYLHLSARKRKFASKFCIK
jgi:hypothetical protein